MHLFDKIARKSGASVHTNADYRPPTRRRAKAAFPNRQADVLGSGGFDGSLSLADRGAHVCVLRGRKRSAVLHSIRYLAADVDPEGLSLAGNVRGGVAAAS